MVDVATAEDGGASGEFVIMSLSFLWAPGEWYLEARHTADEWAEWDPKRYGGAQRGKPCPKADAHVELLSCIPVLEDLESLGAPRM